MKLKVFVAISFAALFVGSHGGVSFGGVDPTTAAPPSSVAVQPLGSPNCLAECLAAQTSCQTRCPAVTSPDFAACHTQCMEEGQVCARRCVAAITGG